MGIFYGNNTYAIKIILNHDIVLQYPQNLTSLENELTNSEIEWIKKIYLDLPFNDKYEYYFYSDACSTYDLDSESFKMWQNISKNTFDDYLGIKL